MKGRVRRGWALPPLWPLLMVGSGLCLFLAWTHVSLTHGLGSFESFCPAGDFFDCDAVNTSPASEILGIPTSVYCLGVYAGMFLLVGPALLDSREGARSRGALRLLATLTLLASGALAWYSHAHLQAWCLFCLALYAVNGLVFLLVCVPPGPLFSLPTGRGFLRALSGALVAFLVTAMGAFGWGAYLNQQTLVSSSSTRLQTESRPAGVVRLPEISVEAVAVEEHNPGLGPVDASVLVVAFSDFECGQCRKLRSTLGALQ